MQSMAVNLYGGSSERIGDDHHDEGCSEATAAIEQPNPMNKTVLHTDPVATVQTTAINIMSNVVGAGILSIPGGVASMSVIPATVMLTLFAVLSAYSMLLLTLCAQRTSRFTYKDLIEHAFSSSLYGRLFDGAIFIYTFACLVAYAHSVGDAMAPVMKTLIGHDNIATVPGFWILMASFVFFPLSSMRQLSELKVTSLFGFLVIVYMVIIIVVYFWSEPSPTGGRVNSQTPWFDLSTGFLVNVPICSVAFSCHYNVPVFYGEMRRRSPTKMVRAVAVAVPMIFALYLVTAYFSVLHFDHETLTEKGDVSLNFPDSYTPMTVARIGLFLHFVCVFPLICIACRRAMNSIVFNRGNMTRPVYIAEAFGLVAASCLLAWRAKSVLEVFSIAGALFGINIVIVIPNVLYLRIVPRGDSDLETIHHSEETGIPSTTRTSDSDASGRRTSSHVPRVPWIENLAVTRGRAMTVLGKILVVLGLMLSFASFALQIYKTADHSSSTPSTIANRTQINLTETWGAAP